MPAVEAFTNFPSTTVSSGGTTAPVSGTTESWTVSSSAAFPAVKTGGAQFHVSDPGLSTEVVAVTNISGTTWSVTRGAESSTPVAHAGGFTIQQVVSAGAFARFLQAVNAVSFGADPSGTNDSTTAIQNAINSASAGQTVCLPAGTYLVSAPLVLPPAIILRGEHGNTFSLTDYGTVIKATAGWAQGGAAGAGMLLLLSQSAGGYGGVSEEQQMFDFMLDGSALVAAADGILVIGNVGSVTIGRVNVSFPSAVGFHGINDAGAHSPAGVWSVDQLQVHRAGTNGINFTATDSTWRNCYVIGSGQKSSADGWVMGTSSNSMFIGCRSEDSIGGNGFTYTATNVSGNGVNFVGCMTQGNHHYGVSVSASPANQAAPLSFSGCRFNEDGTNGGAGGGSLASMLITAYNSTVTIDGCLFVPGRQFVAGGAPDYGLKITSASTANVLVSGSHVAGIVSHFSSDGSGTVQFGPSCILQTGQTWSSPSVYMPQQSVTINSSGNLVPVRPDLADFATGVTGTTAARSAVTTAITTAVSGTLYFHSLFLVAGCPVKNLNFFQGGTVETAGTHGWYELLDNTGKVVAVTADQAGATFFGTANSLVPIATTATYIPTYTGFYYIGVCTVVSSGSVPNWVCSPNIQTSMSAGFGGGAAVEGGTGGTGLTAPPALGATRTLTGTAANQIFGFTS